MFKLLLYFLLRKKHLKTLGFPRLDIRVSHACAVLFLAARAVITLSLSRSLSLSHTRSFFLHVSLSLSLPRFLPLSFSQGKTRAGGKQQKGEEVEDSFFRYSDGVGIRIYWGKLILKKFLASNLPGAEQPRGKNTDVPPKAQRIPPSGPY